MNHQSRQQIEAIHASPTKMVLAITGGGATAIGELLAVPGASRTLLEAIVPYCEVALADWLVSVPEQACSERTARAMAFEAYERTADDELGGTAGVGVTAALVSDRPKRGPHRVHVAWQTAGVTASLSLELEKDARDREAEEAVACQLVLLAIAEACGLEPTLEPTLRVGEKIVRRRVDAPVEWQALFACERKYVTNTCEEVSDAPVLFPGSFDPLHHGHLAMVEIAERLLGMPVMFEISVNNADKLPLDYLELDQRVRQFEGRPHMITTAPHYVSKAKLFPGAIFVVGADTITRIGDLSYYVGEARRRDAAMEELAELGCHFLVFGREQGGKFRSLRDLELPATLAALCEEVPESEFREDVSSSELRNREA